MECLFCVCGISYVNFLNRLTKFTTLDWRRMTKSLPVLFAHRFACEFDRLCLLTGAYGTSWASPTPFVTPHCAVTSLPIKFR